MQQIEKTRRGMRAHWWSRIFPVFLLLVVGPLVTSTGQEVKQNWTHFTRIGAYGLRGGSAAEIVRDAQRDHVFGIEVDNDILGRYESFLNPYAKLKDIRDVSELAHKAGPLAEESLRKLGADLLFLAVDGFDVRYGLTTPNLLEARVNRAMAASARRTVEVCDSSKFGRRTLSLILPTSSVRVTITDKNISKHDLKALCEAGMQVRLV